MMIRGINSQPYIDLDSHIDVEGFSKLHYEICRGLVEAEYKKEGNMVKPGGCDSYTPPFKPLFQALEEYHQLPDDHEIKIQGRILGEYNNRDKFMLFLKLALGAYDPYQFIFLKTEEGGWQSRFDEKAWTSDAVKYFPNLMSWLNRLVEENVFKHLGRIIFFKAEHDCLMPAHRDLILPDETEYFNHRHEFIHIRPNLDKPFYIWDTDLKNKVLVTSRATFFNDQDWHAGGKTNLQTYSLRIDGIFTDQFREKLGISHLDFY